MLAVVCCSHRGLLDLDGHLIILKTYGLAYTCTDPSSFLCQLLLSLILSLLYYTLTPLFSSLLCSVQLPFTRASIQLQGGVKGGPCRPIFFSFSFYDDRVVMSDQKYF